jgi:hypothetical protein
MNSQVLTYINDVHKCRTLFKNGEYGSMTEEQFKIRMSERFQGFQERYPTIFEKTLAGYFEKGEELKRLKMAMGIIENTNSGNLSKEEGEKAFGQHLVDVYVKPNLEENK